MFKTSTKIMHNHHYTTVWKQDYSEQKKKKNTEKLDITFIGKDRPLGEKGTTMTN